MNDDDKRRCCFEGCWRSFEISDADTLAQYSALENGWLLISDWGPGVQRGWYCPPHAKAMRELQESGELDEIQDAILF